MFIRTSSGSIIGVEAHEVIVESHRGKGLPGMALIGLARGAVKESLVRVRSAIRASGIDMSTHRLVVNLLPADLPKDGSALDLALAICLLSSSGFIPKESLKGRRFYGELSLGGGLENVRGSVLIADLARCKKDTELIVPLENANEASIIPDIDVIGVTCLKDVIEHLKGIKKIPKTISKPLDKSIYKDCFSDIYGQKKAKRALEIASAGGHNVLMIGPPGSGKTMLAKRLSGILPELSPEECIEVTRIHSATGSLNKFSLMRRRPFRSPHHTSSEVALCGGGSIPRPGEITLAHRGVLFLDEFPEFSRSSLESLREPLEEGKINIARASYSLTFPAEVLLVASMNPCPCGKFIEGGQKAHKKTPICMCTYDQIQRYRGRVSGPLLDRIDMHVLVDAVPYRDFSKNGSGETSESILKRVNLARKKQSKRLKNNRTNSLMTQEETREFIDIDEASMQQIERAIEHYGLSARAISRIIKVARTIADLNDQEHVTLEHIKEAVSFRILDRESDHVFSHK